jgi:tRNA pseudouridine55 synthase
MNPAQWCAEALTEGRVMLFDKPLTWTSFQAVGFLRRHARSITGNKRIKVGHAGTLDPLATGLLIICTGRATKEINRFMGLEKEYLATLKLGATTASYDGEKPEDAWFPTHHINRALIDDALTAFRGEILQVPPIFSALKVDGKPMYELARKGKAPEMVARPVTIHALEVVSFYGQELVIRVVCSKGTYIRSLAHDIGQALQSGAYLSALRRTRIGPFTTDEALGPEQWDEVLS